MKKFLNEMERKFGKYAINNLTMYIIGLYIVGYIIQLFPPLKSITTYLTLNPYLILHGQVWRLISWVLIPPSALSIWLFITLFLYYYIGTTMERTIGTFRYNVFIFGGMLFMIIAAFVSYGVICFMAGGDETVIQLTSTYYAGCFSTYYVQQAVFLSFALCYPDLQLLLMMIIPIKVKYLGIFYTVLLAYEAIVTGLVNGAFPVFFAILFQFINLGLFYLGTGKLDHLRPKEVNRRHEFQRGVKMTPKGVTRHKCAVCGRSEVDDPNLEFRFCSKCNGNYEYCQDHLFTHQHVK